jgi:dTDP-4-amino-4,6-dideoxy-D-galactose acyltransferase
MDSGLLCRFLDWDTRFFDRRIAQVVSHRFTPDTLVAVETWCAQQAIRCLYFLADLDDAQTVTLAEQHGFALVDVRVELVRALPPAVALSVPPAALRISRADDLPALRQMARTGFTDSRFYADPHFSRAQCDRLYETWIENSCQGYADRVWVAEAGGQPAGFITCHLKPDRQGVIGLVGVDGAAQGQGLGRALVDAALHWFAAEGCDCVRVTTQGRNLRAQRLYQRAGFVSDVMRLWYHRWFETKGQGGRRELPDSV